MTPPKNKLVRWFFFRSRGDSPFMKTIIHLTLILVAFIMLFPALRVITVSLRPGDRLLNTSLDIVPTDRIRVPNGMTEAELNLFRESPVQDIMDGVITVERGILTQIEFANRRRGTVETKKRSVTLKFSNTVLELELNTRLTDTELDKILYRDANRIQEVLDQEIAKKHTFLPGEIRFSENDVRPVSLPEGFQKEALATIVQNQIADNIYSGRLSADWMRYTDEAHIADLEAKRIEINRITLSGTQDEKDNLNAGDINELRLLDQVKSTMARGSIVIGSDEVFSGFMPNNINIPGLQDEILYLVEDAGTISYWTATPSNYLDVLTQTDFFLWIWNSMLITVSTAFLGVVLSSTSAYAFSRFDFPGRKAGLIFLLTTQMIPAGMLMLPLYILAISLNLIGQWSGLVLAYTVGAIPFSIWMLKGYYDTIPKELEEAATIDGATKMQTFYKIMLPLAAPALAIVFLFNFMGAWNDYLLAKIMLDSNDKFTWTLGLNSMQGQFNTKWGQFAAAALMVSVPVMILFLSSSKYLVSGLTLGSVKG